MSIDIKQILLEQFAELYENQDLLSKLTSKDFLHGYGYSEIHCIDQIGNQKKLNVTEISKKMNMTKGAISKIVKKLKEKGDVVSYKDKSNKKEIYYSLTPKGQDLFEEHNNRHLIWKKRDYNFLISKEEDELSKISNFLKEFNEYLEEQISSISS